MGSELVSQSTSLKDTSSRDTTLFLYSKTFEEYCPFFMSIGMTYHEYWEEDCMLAKYYLEMYKLKQERELKLKNQELWLQGLYFYVALCDASPIFQAFAKSGTKPIPYLDKPIPLTEEEVKDNELREKQERLKAFREQLINSAMNGGMKNGR